MQGKRSSTIAAVVLAGGGGTRMRSSLPKVLHPVAGRPILHQILSVLHEALPLSAPIAVVVPPKATAAGQAVIAAVESFSVGREIRWIEQREPRGTGDAFRSVLESPWGRDKLQGDRICAVFPGDFPLMPADLVRALAEPMNKNSPVRLVTCEMPDPTTYGRVIRKGKNGGPVQKITEEKDASSKEKKIREVAVSIYAFEARFAREQIGKLNTRNAQKEFYLTDLIALAAKARKKIDVLSWPDWKELRGVNNQWELAQASRELNERILKSWSERGVRFIDPMTTWVESTVELGAEVVIHPGTSLSGVTRVASGAEIGPHASLQNVTVGERTRVKQGVVAIDSVMGADCQVGPYVHLRPGSHLAEKAKLGNFVELKNTRIGASTSVAHLSYLGDAEVGERVNIGCGFVTCNFDGRVIEGQRKHKTVIEDDVFMGSDCQTIAPVRVGKGAYVASGSTVTENVEPGALAIARSRQVNKPGYARKLKQE